ncbi:MFS transporter [Flaviaesturariibacter amylovorans]|uniref:MFS transporter n=1 Tax=Flaviaesturariibacter amylovorans TaxID=1084520 RepID=A0ABP8H1J6_9BACT
MPLPAPEPLLLRHRLRAIFGGSIGNLVEWYDWYAYTAFALYFSPRFFPKGDLTAQLLNTAGIFAVGFFMRPVGSWFFGRIADRQGRKRAMTLSVLLMSFGSLLIACIPSYERVGLLAPGLLLLARLLQGLSVGGEYGTSATYLSEMATPERRGFFASFQYVTLIGGQLLALAVQLVLQQFLSAGELAEWGWRIPFFIGAALSVVALYIRSHLRETDAFLEQKDEAAALLGSDSPLMPPPERGSLAALARHPKALLTVVGLTLGGTIAFYTFSIYIQKFLVNSAGFSKEVATRLSFFSLLIFALLQPLFGWLSDRVGRRPLLLGFGVLGTLATYPLLTALGRVDSTAGAFGLMMAGLLIVSGYTSINAVVKAELFPAGVRALGVGLPYAVTTALFGGTVEYIALYFKEQGREPLFFIYVSGCIFLSLIVYWTMPETRHRRLAEGGAGTTN